VFNPLELFHVSGNILRKWFVSDFLFIYEHFICTCYARKQDVFFLKHGVYGVHKKISFISSITPRKINMNLNKKFKTL